MMDKITNEKVKKYFSVTEQALAKVKGNIVEGKEKEAREIIEMVENYFSDARHFKEKGNLVDAFAALNYSHGWLDCGVRTGVFDVDDESLFTVR